MVKEVSPGLTPDLVDLIFDYVVAEFPELAARASELKLAARQEFGGETAYIPRRSEAERRKLVSEVLSSFNGRNASEVGRRLRISRATVYRIIKTSGK